MIIFAKWNLVSAENFPRTGFGFGRNEFDACDEIARFRTFIQVCQNNSFQYAKMKKSEAKTKSLTYDKQQIIKPVTNTAKNNKTHKNTFELSS